MTKTKESRQESRVYHERYNSKRRNKTVSFRTDSPIESELLKFADTLDNFGEWVKTKIREEIRKRGQ